MVRYFFPPLSCLRQRKENYIKQFVQRCVWMACSIQLEPGSHVSHPRTKHPSVIQKSIHPPPNRGDICSFSSSAAWLYHTEGLFSSEFIACINSRSTKRPSRGRRWLFYSKRGSIVINRGSFSFNLDLASQVLRHP